jgi:hypothetical protein
MLENKPGLHNSGIKSEQAQKASVWVNIIILFKMAQSFEWLCIPRVIQKSDYAKALPGHNPISESRAV